MPKLPYFKFYPDDWLSSPKVIRMTDSQKGIYITLLAFAWKHPSGCLPNDKKILQRLCPRSRWENIQYVIDEAFVKDERGLYNLRLQSEQSAAFVKSNKASNSANSRWNKEKGRANALRTQSEGNDSHSHSQNHSQKDIQGGTVSGKVMTIAHEKATAAWNEFYSACEKHFLDGLQLVIEDPRSRKIFTEYTSPVVGELIKNESREFREQFIRRYREDEIKEFNGRKKE